MGKLGKEKSPELSGTVVLNPGARPPVGDSITVGCSFDIPAASVSGVRVRAAAQWFPVLPARDLTLHHRDPHVPRPLSPFRWTTCASAARPTGPSRACARWCAQASTSSARRPGAEAAAPLPHPCTVTQWVYTARSKAPSTKLAVDRREHTLAASPPRPARPRAPWVEPMAGDGTLLRYTLYPLVSGGIASVAARSLTRGPRLRTMLTFGPFMVFSELPAHVALLHWAIVRKSFSGSASASLRRPLDLLNAAGLAVSASSAVAHLVMAAAGASHMKDVLRAEGLPLAPVQLRERLARALSLVLPIPRLLSRNVRTTHHPTPPAPSIAPMTPFSRPRRSRWSAMWYLPACEVSPSSWTCICLPARPIPPPWRQQYCTSTGEAG